MTPEKRAAKKQYDRARYLANKPKLLAQTKAYAQKNAVNDEALEEGVGIGLGLFRDRPEALRRAATYLEKP